MAEFTTDAGFQFVVSSMTLSLAIIYDLDRETSDEATRHVTYDFAQSYW